MKRKVISLLLFLSLVASSSNARVGGERVTLIVPNSAGGLMVRYARMIAP